MVVAAYSFDSKKVAKMHSHRSTHGRHGLHVALTMLLSAALTACSASPSRNILGSYFPSWMVCALLGLALALVARAIFKALGILGEIPAPLVVMAAIGCAGTFAMWLIWLS